MDIVEALTPHDGRTMDGVEMYKFFKTLRGEYWREIPFEVKVDDLFDHAQSKGLIKVEEDGRLTISLKKYHATIKTNRLKAIVKDQIVALIVREATMQRQPMWSDSQPEDIEFITNEVIRLSKVLIVNG